MGGLTDEQIRGAGVSGQKLSYIRDLTDKWLSGEIRHRQFARMSDEAIIEELTQVKGIGRWTVQMFLMFCLCRADVFAPDDLGLRNAIRNLYGLDDLPNRQTSEQIAQSWSPYSTVASWYLWRSLELPED